MDTQQRLRKTAKRTASEDPMTAYLHRYDNTDSIDAYLATINHTDVSPMEAYVAQINHTDVSPMEAYLAQINHTDTSGMDAIVNGSAFGRPAVLAEGQNESRDISARADAAMTDFLNGVRAPAREETQTTTRASVSGRQRVAPKQRTETPTVRETRVETGAGVGVLSGTRLVDAAPVSETAIIADAIATTATPEDATTRILETLQQRHPEETQDAILTRAFTAIWRNIKPITYIVVTTAMLSVSVGLVSAYLVGSGGWLGLLAALKAAGVTAVPAVLRMALRSTGISLASNATINTVLGLAERNKRVESLLRKQIKPALLVNTLNRMGVDVRNTDMSVKAFTRAAIANGISIASGDMSTYLISTGLTTGVRVASAGVTATRAGLVSAIGRIRRAEQTVVDRSLAPLATEAETETASAEVDAIPVDAVDIAREVAENAVRTAPADARAVTEAPAGTETSTGTEAPTGVSVVNSAREVLVENRIAVAATTTAIALTAVALTGDVSTMVAMTSSAVSAMGGTVGSAIGGIATSTLATNASAYLAEHTMARQALFGIISQQTGLQRVFDVLVDRLTPESMQEMRKLEGQIRKSRNKDQRIGYTARFFSLLVGDKIYDPAEIEKMTITKLKEIASAKRIRFPTNVTKKALVDAIRQEQLSRVNALTATVAGTITGALKTSLAAATLEYGYQSYPITTLTVPEIDALLQETGTDATAGSAVEDRIETKSPIDDAERIIRRETARRERVEAQHEEAYREELDARQSQTQAERATRRSEAKAARAQERVRAADRERTERHAFEETVDAAERAERIRADDVANRQEMNRLIEEGERLEAMNRQALEDRRMMDRLIEEGEANEVDLANRRLLSEIIEEGEREAAELRDRVELRKTIEEYEALRMKELEYQQQLDAQQSQTQASKRQHRADVKQRQLEDKHKAAQEAAERAARTVTRAAERLQARRLADAARLAQAEQQREVIVSGPEGNVQVPTANRLLDPEIQKALDVKITPLLFYLKNAAADSLLSYIPGVGMVNSVLTTAQWSLDVASTLRTATRIARAVAGPGTAEAPATVQTLQEVTALDAGAAGPATPAPVPVSSGEPSRLAEAETYASERLDQVLASGGPPTLTKVVGDMIQDDQVHLKTTVLRALRNKIVYGWDDARVAYEIGKEVIAGKRLGDTLEQQTLQAATFTDGMLRDIGGMVWSQIDKVGGLRQGNF